VSDERDAASLYQVLEEEVIPLYYDRDIDGLPRQWIKADDEFHQFAGLAIQCRPNGGRLRAGLLFACRRRRSCEMGYH